MLTTVRRLLGAAAVVTVVAAPSAAHGGPSAPMDGATATSGGMTLTTSQAADLSPGQTVTVTGSGYDEEKGIYVALCVVPPTGTAPSPCGGGQDRSGTGGASAWVSSNPPSYARGLTTPYGPGGTFTVSLTLSPTLPDGLDCYSVRCAIYTRADHTRGSDRSLDVGIPVTFTAPVATTAPPAAAPPTTLPPTTAPESTTTTVAPSTTAPSTTTAATEDDAAAEADASDEDEAASPVALAADGDDGDGPPVGAVPLAVAVLVVGGGLVTRLVRRGRPAKPVGVEPAP